MNTRPIPSTKEPLPVIGCGTYVGFDHPPGTPEYAQLPGVVAALLDGGGRVLDSSPMYGRAEETTGELIAAERPARARRSSPPRSGRAAAPRACGRWRTRCVCCAPTAST